MARFWLAATIVLAAPVTAEEPLFNAEGYRIAHYRGPVPAPPDGDRRIGPVAPAILRPDEDAIFIDLLPAEGGHRDPGSGRWTLAAPHLSIAGSHWFPEAGRGNPDPVIARWFERGVARLTNRRRDHAVILFCRADCWMGWNGAKRLAAAGYRNIRWMAEGTDGWRDLGLPLVEVAPER